MTCPISFLFNMGNYQNSECLLQMMQNRVLIEKCADGAVSCVNIKKIDINKHK